MVVSKPTIRINHGKENQTLHDVNKHLNLECIENGNINVQHLDRKGFHLNSKGKGRHALNFLNQTWKFLRPVEQFNKPFLSYDPSDEVDHLF